MPGRPLIALRDHIAARREAEEAARANQERFQLLVDNYPGAIVIYDAACRFVFVNDWAVRLIGRSQEELVGQRDEDLFPPEITGAYLPLLRQSVATGMPQTAESTVSFLGESIHLVVHYVPLLDADGTVHEVLGIARDITDRQRVLSRLSESEERFRMAFAAAPLGIALMARDGTLLEVNRALCEMLDCSEKELTGLNIADITYGEDLARTRSHVEAAFADGRGTSTIEKRYITKKGRVIWGRVTSTVLRDARGEAIYNIRMIQDISESRRTDHELERYQEHLEELVRSRTRALEASQESLRSAERLASLGTLAAGIAHEINNPVGTILLAAEMALAAEAGGDRAALTRCLEAIKADAQRCGRIVKNVLSFSRQQPTDKSPYPLNEIVRQAVERTQDYAVRRAATLETTFHDGVGRVLMNPVAIEQALVNILRNAIESRQDKVSVRVATAVSAGRYTVIINDDGPGMSSDVQRHIFDPFFTMRRTDGGTGLGLSLVHGTINDHWGSIHVDSALGQGTTFTIDFPTYEEPL